MQSVETMGEKLLEGYRSRFVRLPEGVAYQLREHRSVYVLLPIQDAELLDRTARLKIASVQPFLKGRTGGYIMGGVLVVTFGLLNSGLATAYPLILDQLPEFFLAGVIVALLLQTAPAVLMGLRWRNFDATTRRRLADRPRVNMAQIEAHDPRSALQRGLLGAVGMIFAAVVLAGLSTFLLGPESEPALVPWMGSGVSMLTVLVVALRWVRQRDKNRAEGLA
jgi:Na+/proline symporter